MSNIFPPLFLPTLDTPPTSRPHFCRPSATALRSVPSGEFHPKNSRRGCKKLLFLVGSCHDAVCWSSVLELLAVRYVHRSCCSVVCVCVCFAFLPPSPPFSPRLFLSLEKAANTKVSVCLSKQVSHTQISW